MSIASPPRKPPPGATRPYRPKLPAMKHAPTLEQYEARKRRQLDQLRRENRQREQIFDSLKAETRQAQLRKSRDLTESNPLGRDESESYAMTMAKVRKMHFANRK
jgi:hypothetical protein